MEKFLAPVGFVKTEEKKIRLNSNLDETMFGKTKSSLLLEETGILAEKNGGKWNKFSEWKFDEIKTEDEKVYFCGNFSGKTLLSLIETEPPESLKTDEAVFAVCEIYANAIEENVKIPCNGAAGILVNLEEGKILLLPEKTFDRAAANFGKNLYNYFQNDWRDFIATGNSAAGFALGTMAYFAAAKKLPYSEENDKKISDRNFIPLEQEINGINKNLAAAVDSLLLGKTLKNPFPLDELKKQIFGKESEKHKIPEAEFEKKAQKFRAAQRSRLKRLRFVRKNIAVVAAVLCAGIFITVAVLSIAGENAKKPSAIGLDSAQVTEVFYKGIHTMDTDLMLCAAKDCPEAQGYISKVPQIYITTQMKSAYNFDSGISTPENWFFFEPDSTKAYSHYIYGITNFSIDGKNSALEIKVPTKKNHPARKVYSEDGSRTKIEKSPDATHTVKYFLVHNQDNLIQAEEFTTTATLRFSGKAWTITKLDQTSSSEFYSPLQVSLDFKQALSEHQGNEIAAVDSLRKKYPWLPTKKSMEIEKERLEKIGY